MVLTSAQIAQMNGSFQGQAMNQMAYSGMIGQLSPYSGERMAGSAMNTVGSIASPLVTGGLALAGLDPISMAFRGGLAGAGGGMAGMAAGALGGAAAVGLPLMAAGYAGGQFMQGAQQHQMLGSQLRSSFGFRNQFGGNGFTGGEVGGIGSMMRDMSTQVGPGGEQVSFEELGRLAGNMGRMGMAQGVRNAKDFTDKFKQMVSTLKEIATEMGTSLEEAQKMMAGMKQSGVFGTGQMKQFASMIRTGAQAGGMATSELTGMMSVGSQISRMIGGRGVSGARGGIETITNIGIAQQMGILSEEDIFNATGQTGAMGRRALATQQMQGAAQFLRGGLGRRMMAAMAGKNGQLDEGDAEAFAAGGVGVDETRRMWQENLKGVGRANFIRNEGRLRGEVLGKFGGLTPIIAMKGWLEGKGIDVNQDNDRAMLFMQRRLNLGRDEADVMMKQMRDLPAILRERDVVGKEESMAQRLNARSRTTGVEGLKRKLDQAVTEVRSEFNAAGQGFMVNLENEFERFVNFLTDTRVKEFRRDAVRAFETGKLGGATGAAAMSQTFGIGGGMVANMRRLQVPGQRQSNLEIGRGIMAEALGFKGGFMGEFDRVDRERLAKRGFDMTGLDQQGISARLQDIGGFAEAAAGRGVDISLTGDSKSRLRDMYSRVQGLGEDRAKSVQAMLLSSDDPQAQAIGKRLAQAGSSAEKGKIIAGLNRALGRADEGKLYSVPDMMGVYNTSSHLTYKDQASAIGEALLGTSGQGGIAGLTTGKQANSVIDFLSNNKFLGRNGLGMLIQMGTKALVKRGVLGGLTAEAVEATGTFARSDEGRQLAAKALDSDAATRAQAAETVQAQIAKLEAKQASGDASVVEQGTMEYLRSIRAAQRLQEVGGANASKEAIAKAARDLNMSPEQLMTRAAGVVGLVSSAQKDAVMQFEGTESRERLRRMGGGGLITEGKGGVQLSEAMAKEFTGPAGDFLRAVVNQEAQLASINEATSFEGRQRVLEGVFGKGGTVKQQQDELRKMSVPEMRRLAEGLRGRGAGEVRQELLAASSMRERLSRGGRGRGLSNIAGALGSNLNAKDIKRIMSEGGIGQLAGTIMEDLGLTDEASRKDISEALGGMQGGDVATAEQKVRAVLGGTEMMEARKKKSLAAAEQSDPLQAKGNELLKSIDGKLDKQLTALTSIATNTMKEAKDAEGQPA